MLREMERENKSGLIGHVENFEFATVESHSRIFFLSFSLSFGLLSFLLAFFSFFFLGLHLWQMEVLKLRAESALQLLTYATVTAMGDPSHLCDLHCSLCNPGFLTH